MTQLSFLRLMTVVEVHQEDVLTNAEAIAAYGEIRSDPRMQKLHILLHTSLSGVFNQAMVKKVGADDFLAKFKPDDLASRVVERIRVADGG